MFVSDQVCGGNVDFFESASTELYNYRNYLFYKLRSCEDVQFVPSWIHPVQPLLLSVSVHTQKNAKGTQQSTWVVFFLVFGHVGSSSPFKLDGSQIYGYSDVVHLLRLPQFVWTERSCAYDTWYSTSRTLDTSSRQPPLPGSFWTAHRFLFGYFVFVWFVFILTTFFLGSSSAVSLSGG